MEKNVKLLEFCHKVSKLKMGSKKGFSYDDPRYMLLEKVVTEEMAEVALALEFRVHMTVEEVAKRCNKPVEKTKELLWDLAMAGAATIKKEDNLDYFWVETWVPGIFEMVVNNKENVRKYPQIGRAFDDYGILRNPVGYGNIPVGKGLMRVIPIQSSLDGTSRVASSEEVSTYLESARVISVSDCSCRTSREENGEGCGHLKEDMCIQLNDAAEYYIRTGRGREIQKEEAYDIIARAEKNGLMHQIPNTEGEGHTHAICNCCYCSCYALRAATMYNNPDMVRSNFTSQVDEESCVGCGECVDVCPTGAIKLGEKLCSSVDKQTIKRIDVPFNSDWSVEKLNTDYRINREESLKSGTVPCKTDCPAHISIPAYIKLASLGRYKEALEMIKKDNPFPAVCGRICPALCESACSRGNLDEAVAIDDIKKFIAKQDLDSDNRYIPEIKHNYRDKHIAIIGGGPAGLSCAYYLAIEGYKVTVFEKENTLGGMLNLGIPAFRLEKDVINAEIDVLREIGVEFKTGIEIGKDITIPELRKGGYKAFFIAIGAQGGRGLGLENEDAINVKTGVEYLRNVGLKKEPKQKGKTVVIGGGNVAIDVARTTLRQGSTKTTMVCLESRDSMPALEDEIHEALEENIIITNGYGPHRILVKDNKVTGVEFKRCLQIFDENKRFNPIYDEKDILTLEADQVIMAIGQSIEWNELLKGTEVQINPNQTIKVDPKTLQSTDKDIFAGGDVATGPRYAVDAIALGKEGSISIHRFVQRGQSLVFGRKNNAYFSLNTDDLDLSGYDHVSRERTYTKHIDKIEGSFEDPRGTLTEEQVKNETSRCLKCGITIVDEFMCVGCGACTTRCKFDAIKLVKTRNETGVDFADLKKVVIKHAVKRKVRISFRNFKSKFTRNNKNA
jgi:NADPH-dependent glutamate synthase beta subunit-like oxidoreductase/NAD-dependent dihydropyrimidine dehydrogenase PreA subunit